MSVSLEALDALAAFDEAAMNAPDILRMFAEAREPEITHPFPVPRSDERVWNYRIKWPQWRLSPEEITNARKDMSWWMEADGLSQEAALQRVMDEFVSGAR